MKTIHSTAYHIVLKAIRDTRRARGVSQATLAERVGWKNQTVVSRVEAGERRIDIVEFLRICRTLDLPWTEVMAAVEQEEIGKE